VNVSVFIMVTPELWAELTAVGASVVLISQALSFASSPPVNKGKSLLHYRE